MDDALHVTPEGFCWEGPRSGALDWANVCEIVTWKQDLVTTDRICLAFRLKHAAAEGDAVVIHEEQPGFMDVADAMRRYFPAILPDWYFEVMQPPFETKLTRLYKAGAAS